MFLIKSFEKYLFLEIIPNNWEQKHRPPGAYRISKDYANVMKFKRLHRSSTQNRQKTQKAKKIRRKCRLLKSRIEQNNDHTRIIREMQYRCSFNKTMIGK